MQMYIHPEAEDSRLSIEWNSVGTLPPPFPRQLQWSCLALQAHQLARGGPRCNSDRMPAHRGTERQRRPPCRWPAMTYLRWLRPQRAADSYDCASVLHRLCALRPLRQLDSVSSELLPESNGSQPGLEAVLWLRAVRSQPLAIDQACCRCCQAWPRRRRSLDATSTKPPIAVQLLGSAQPACKAGLARMQVRSRKD